MCRCVVVVLYGCGGVVVREGRRKVWCVGMWVWEGGGGGSRGQGGIAIDRIGR